MDDFISGHLWKMIIAQNLKTIDFLNFRKKKASHSVRPKILNGI